MQQELRYLGPDVHSQSIALALAEGGGEVRLYGTISGDLHALEETVMGHFLTQYENSTVRREWFFVKRPAPATPINAESLKNHNMSRIVSRRFLLPE